MVDPDPVELKAWKVWEDAGEAISLLESNVEKQPNANWRIYFIAAVTLLRATGHILEKVDADSDPEIRRRVQKAWPRMKNDRLFVWSKSARDSALKLYELGVSQMTAWSWTGDAQFPEDAPDAVEEGMLFVDGSSDNALERLRLAWYWWGQVLGDIKFDRQTNWPEADW